MAAAPIPKDARVRRLRARLAATKDPKLREQARRELQELAAENRVRDMVDAYPPLSLDTRVKLARIILGGDRDQPAA
ncbi:MAG TPA: hypothetical protein VF054_06680 [Micromonosporaceae bacterium]